MNINSEIARIFEDISDALEFKGENIFKINAYRKAARIVREYPGDISKVNFSQIKGIGKGMAEKISEYISTGKIKKYSETISDIPPGLPELLQIQNLGPKTLYLVYKELGVQKLEDLEKVLKNGQLAKLPNMGDKKAEKISRGIELYKAGKARTHLGIALPIAEDIISLIKNEAKQVSTAGSLRRMQETAGDIDILAAGGRREKILEIFTGFTEVKTVLLKGPTKASVIIKPGNMQVDIRIVDEDCWGAALQYFTGSKEHNVKIRGLAASRNLKINEYGVFKKNDRVAGQTEESVYNYLGMQWIPPEMREDRGEIEASLAGNLPKPISLEDIKGDFHVHSNYSDGISDIKTIAAAAKSMGYEYIGICDHSKTSRIANGLDVDTLKKRNAEIDEVKKRIKGIRILKGMEVDILQEGQLDYPDIVLEQLDFVIAAIHQGFSKNVTQRIKKAIDNPFVDIIAHPTGRLLSGREGYDINLEEILQYAARKNVALEINASYDRLDLNDVNILKAKSFGARFLIGTDAHNTEMLGTMQLGTGTAKRGWLTKKDVINTYAWDKIPLRRRRKS